MRPGRTPWFEVACLCLLLVTALAYASGVSGSKLSADDVAAIEALHHAYSKAWVRNDQAGVLGVFTRDAVLMPHHGGEPRVGTAAIKAFWFPTGASTTMVTKLDLKTDEIGGHGELAFARGRFSLSWTMEAQGKIKTFSNAGTYLDILRKQADGSWKITHHMWDDPVPQIQ